MYYMLLDISATSEIPETLTELRRETGGRDQETQYTLDGQWGCGNSAQRAILRECAGKKDLNAVIQGS